MLTIFNHEHIGWSACDAQCKDSSDTTQDDDVSVPIPSENLKTLSVKQLKAIIKGKGLRPKGPSKLKEKELIEVIEKS